MDIEGHVRAGALSGFRELVYELGGDPTEIFKSLDICEVILTNPDNFITGLQHRQAMIMAARQTGIPSFGLLLSQKQSLQKFGAVGYLAQHAATVGDSFKILVKYIRIHDTVTLPDLSISDGMALLSLKIPSVSGESMVQQAETGIGIALRIFRSLINENWSPKRVFFEHKQPDDMTMHDRILRCPIDFEQTVTAMEFPASDLTQKNINSDPQLFNILSAHIKQTVEHDEGYLEDRIRSEIVKGLATGRVTLSDISAALGLSRNRLQRLLKDMDTSFQELLDQTRFHIAQSYLNDTNLPITEITFLLAYSEPAVFTRAFKRQTGVTPSQWRGKNAELRGTG